MALEGAPSRTYCYAMKRSPIALIAVIALLIVATIVMRRRGYAVGANTVVRCRSGHLFTTIWIPGASLTAIRLGPMRLQYCPVGRHWTLVTLVKDSALTDEDRQIASENRDLPIP